MSNQAKRLSNCPAERLSHCRGEAVPPAGGNSYVEARQCDACDHVGINDAASGLGACHKCDWQGSDPVEDECPGCGNQNCMAAACPKCGARYALIAEANLAIAVPPAGDVEVQRYHVQLFKLSGEQQKYAHGALGAVQVVRASEFDRAAAEVSALQQRLNIADQHVSDPQAEVAKLRRGPCELIYGDELPNQGIPGTSFQRLNALANEGE